MKLSVYGAVATSILASVAIQKANADEWPTERLGDRAFWDAAYDRSTGERFIPTQAVVPGVWDGHGPLPRHQPILWTVMAIAGAERGKILSLDRASDRVLRARTHKPARGNSCATLRLARAG